MNTSGGTPQSFQTLNGDCGGGELTLARRQLHLGGTLLLIKLFKLVAPN